MKTEWISVKDRLPDLSLKYVDVWMNRKGGGYRFANYVLFEDIKEEFLLHNITHWMPLPEPPTQ